MKYPSMFAMGNRLRSLATPKNVLIYTAAVIIVTISFTLFLVDKARCLDESVDLKRFAVQFRDESTLYFNNEAADKLFNKVRILCIIPTVERSLDNRVAVVNNTWAKRCSKVIYVMCTDKKYPDVLSTCFIKEGKEHLTGKVRYALMHSYKYYLQTYDWFLKADDDTYVVMENLRFLLSHYPTDEAGYLGYHFKLKVEQGYMSGGAGYVINRQGLKQLVEHGFQRNACLQDLGDEDVEIGKCLQFSNVTIFSSLDKFGRETFHTDQPWEYNVGRQPEYLVRYSKNKVKEEWVILWFVNR